MTYKKILLILLAALIVFGVALGIFLFYQKHNYVNNDNNFAPAETNTTPKEAPEENVTTAQTQWDIADGKTVRLSPEKFPELPKNIAKELDKRGCTIPQLDPLFKSTEDNSNKLNNVISGEFSKKGQTDWAVLCSINKESSIIVFWNGSVDNIYEFPKESDKYELQEVDGNGQIGYSRIITTADEKTVDSYYGDSSLKIDHEGIEDVFAEKTSYIYYYNNKEWLNFVGAD